ncbi:MAG TPA: GNAT family N-acetyltransferase [Solirubrobacterales bacterium]|jgi:CelD/BcsL family acetyltransferase involved in cellulose biosynthesis|nr:GNAT family N-acetyltransferase [Solirubrobacterales bacterium]
MSERTAAAEVLTLADEDRWRQLLPASEGVFGSFEFAATQHLHVGGEPRLFALAAPGGAVAHSLSLRPVAELPFAADIAPPLFDAATPPYAGPFARGTVDASAGAQFAGAFERWCADAGVVTEFAHLHPWRARIEALADADLHVDREIVYVDLTLDPERLWRESFTHACRKNINRARREGVRVFEATSEAHALELHRIYEHTMERRGALGAYRVPPGYFPAFLERMPDNARIVLAEHDGRVVAATLYLHDDDDAYSYLGGADHDYQRLRPTNAVVHEMILWARERGIKRLVLGGGYAPDDGILRFKSSFSPLRREFRVYRRVHLRDAYDEVVERWREADPGAESGGYFPPYRQGS